MEIKSIFFGLSLILILIMTVIFLNTIETFKEKTEIDLTLREHRDFQIGETLKKHKCVDKCKKNNNLFWLNSNEYNRYRDCMTICHPNPGINPNPHEKHILNRRKY